MIYAVGKAVAGTETKWVIFRISYSKKKYLVQLVTKVAARAQGAETLKRQLFFLSKDGP